MINVKRIFWNKYEHDTTISMWKIAHNTENII